MDATAFWAMIDQVLDVPLDDRAELLQERLARRSEADITDFADHLAGALHRLDTPAHSAAVGEAGGDAFLYMRCAAILAGSAAYQRMIDDPAVFAVHGDGEAERLLFVAPNAHERSTDMPWEHGAPVSDEPQWLLFGTGQGLHVVFTPEYQLTQMHLIDALNASEVWTRWWRGAKVPSAEAFLIVDRDSLEQVKVRKGRKVVRAEVVRHRNGFGSAAGATEPEKARDDIRAVLAVIAEKVGLPMPELPPLPDLGEDELRALRAAHEESAATDRLAEELMRHLDQG